MCFSATASFTAGAVLTVAGAACVRQVRRREDTAFAAIPLLFAAQQVTEGFVWLSFEGASPALTAWLTQIYSVFSHLLWPIYVPLAVWLMEPAGRRRTLLAVLIGLGLAVALLLLAGMVSDPIVARPVGGHIDYESPHFYVAVVMLLYVTATTFSMVLTSHPMVRLFGALALAAAALSYWAYARWFISVWCFFAAALSVVVYLHLGGNALDRISYPQRRSS